MLQQLPTSHPCCFIIYAQTEQARESKEIPSIDCNHEYFPNILTDMDVKK
jgi:hypothetical protein